MGQWIGRGEWLQSWGMTKKNEDNPKPLYKFWNRVQEVTLDPKDLLAQKAQKVNL